jgi:6-phosphofructokinase 1
MNIAIMCSGGDACGMNPALKSFVDNCYNKNITPYFIYDGLEGLIDGNIKQAYHKDVAGIVRLGGTIIRTSRSKRFYDKMYRLIAYTNLQQYKINKLIVLGGDGSFNALNAFSKEFDISFVGIPSTIDNDIKGTDYCLGVDTALNVIVKALDNIRDTASSFKRAFVVETMGRDCGYLAATSAVTSGAEICIVPEHETDLDSIEIKLKQEIKEGRNYILAVVAEGTNKTEFIAKWIEEKLNIETRIVNLGHIQRGGSPTVYDRVMANDFVVIALNKLIKNDNLKSAITYKRGVFEFINIEQTKKD